MNLYTQYHYGDSITLEHGIFSFRVQPTSEGCRIYGTAPKKATDAHNAYTSKTWTFAKHEWDNPTQFNEKVLPVLATLKFVFETDEVQEWLTTVVPAHLRMEKIKFVSQEVENLTKRLQAYTDELTALTDEELGEE